MNDQTHIEVVKEAHDTLIEYLLDSELDIFNNINNFGLLYQAFYIYIGRWPEAKK